MRLAPVVLLYSADAQSTWHYAGESTRTTHGAQEAIDCSRLFALQLRQAFMGASKEEILSARPREPLSAAVAALADRSYLHKSADEVRGTGYCVASLEAALWCFTQSTTFAEAVLRAVNLGDDADTTAAICGQLAGAFYGVQCIPAAWLGRLTMREEMQTMASQLLALADGSPAGASDPVQRPAAT